MKKKIEKLEAKVRELHLQPGSPRWCNMIMNNAELEDKLKKAEAEIAGMAKDGKTEPVEPDCFIEVKQAGYATEDAVWYGALWDYTVDDLKSFIFKKQGIPVQEQRLICAGKQVCGSSTIAEVIAASGETETTRLHLTLEQSGGGPKRERESKDVRLVAAKESSEVMLLKLSALGDPCSALVKNHVEQVMALGDDAPMEKAMATLTVEELKKLQNIGITGREETRLGKIAEVMFAFDLAETKRLSKIAQTSEDAINVAVQVLFYSTFMTEDGTLEWSRFFKFVKYRISVPRHRKYSIQSIFRFFKFVHAFQADA